MIGLLRTWETIGERRRERFNWKPMLDHPLDRARIPNGQDVSSSRELSLFPSRRGQLRSNCNRGQHDWQLLFSFASNEREEDDSAEERIIPARRSNFGGASPPERERTRVKTEGGERNPGVRAARIPRGAFRKHLPPTIARAETTAACHDQSAARPFYCSTSTIRASER